MASKDNKKDRFFSLDTLLAASRMEGAFTKYALIGACTFGVIGGLTEVAFFYCLGLFLFFLFIVFLFIHDS